MLNNVFVLFFLIKGSFTCALVSEKQSPFGSLFREYLTGSEKIHCFLTACFNPTLLYCNCVHCMDLLGTSRAALFTLMGLVQRGYYICYGSKNII